MAEPDIVQARIDALGCSQREREAAALAPGFAPVHAFDAAALLVQSHALAQRLRHHSAGMPAADAPDWTPFFPVLTPDQARALLERSDGGVSPHLALYAAFARLFDRHARSALNRFTERQLDFQWRQVLGFAPSAMRPDHALVQLELKKGAPAPLAVGSDSVFLAGKDARGVERRYRPVRETFVSHARVVAARALHRDAAGRVFAAPVAASADGLGAPLPPEAPGWSAFAPPAGVAWPAAGLGCAVASPLLALVEGEREIELRLTLADAMPPALAARLSAAFEASLSTAAGWSEARRAEALASGPTQIVVRVRLGAADAAVVPVDAALHGAPWRATTLPVLRLTLAAQASIDGLDRLQLRAAALAVRVRGLSGTLALENDAGALDPKRAFQPFGAQPVAGARFMVGCPEALGKPLTSLALRLVWQGAPASLSTHYARYSRVRALDNGVTATLIFEDGLGRRTRRTLDLMARDGEGVSTLRPDSLPPAPETWKWREPMLMGSLERLPGSAGSRLAFKLRARPGPLVAQAAARAGFVTLQLNEDFLHADWRRENVAALLADPKNPLAEPYTPTVSSIALDYEAAGPEVSLARGADEDTEADDFADAALQFFHLGAFGARREHPWLSRHHPWGGAGVALLPRAAHEGELMVGLTGVGAGDALSLLVQVAPGSADPALEPPALEWSVLAGERWKPLAPEAIAHEGTRGLLDSGTVALALPAETGTAHDWMPAPAEARGAGVVWLRVAATANTRATCALRALAANGVELRFADQGNDPGHALQPLPAMSIAKLAQPLPGLKSVTQPFASFGARAAESAAALSRRAAERLRHRDRALAPWDVERLVLEAFPALHRVKCLPHARPGQWFAPGHLMLVVVPRVEPGSAADRARPRADLGTLEAVRAFVQRRAALGAQVSVTNACFEALRLDFTLAPRAGVAFNPLRARVHALLQRALAPWAFDDGGEREIAFGGRVYRSALLARVESEPGVDFVTEFKLQALGEDGRPGPDSAALQASRPDAILVGAAAHTIREA